MEKELTAQESHKIELLLRPRYKVIADYPGSDYSVGDIIPLTNYHSNEWHSRDEDGQVIEQESFYKQFPHLFKQLEWWEERAEADLPIYVKERFDGKVLLIQYNMGGHTPCCVKTWNKFELPFHNVLQDLLPATESEYNEYLTHSQAGER